MDNDEIDDRQDASPDAAAPPRPQAWRGLSGKVLALAVMFVMVGEVLIFLPSIANFRVGWLQNRIAIAEVAVLAVEAAPEQKVFSRSSCKLGRKDGGSSTTTHHRPPSSKPSSNLTSVFLKGELPFPPIYEMMNPDLTCTGRRQRWLRR